MMQKRILLVCLALVVATLACGLPVGGNNPNQQAWPPKDQELPITYAGIGSQIHLFADGETCSVAANGTVTIHADKTCSAEINFEITNINTDGKCETSAELGIQNVLVTGAVSESFDVCNFSRYPASDQIFVDPESKADIGNGWAKLNIILLDGQKEPIHQITIDELSRTK